MRLKKQWAYYFFCFEVVMAWIAVVLRRPVSSHYIIFTEPARLLWGGMDPYGNDFGAGGLYFYSPACAMFFFSLFAWLPRPVGLALYMAISLAAFFFALRFFLSTVKRHIGFDLDTSPLRHLFWLMLGSEVLGAVLAAKLELLMVSILFFSVALLIEGRRIVLAAALLGVITNWKLQPLPIVGLVFLVYYLLTRSLRPVLGFIGALALLYLLPALFMTWSQFIGINRHWRESLGSYMARDWLEEIYQHIYAFLYRGLGVSIELGTATMVTGFAALLLASTFAVWTHRMRSEANSKTWLVTFAFAIGAAFIHLFSPLSQSNGYVLYVPLVVVYIMAAEQLKFPRARAMTLLVVAYFLISIFYSDLVPRPWYRVAYQIAVKPLGVLLLGIGLVPLARRLRPMRRFDSITQARS